MYVCLHVCWHACISSHHLRDTYVPNLLFLPVVSSCRCFLSFLPVVHVSDARLWQNWSIVQKLRGHSGHVLALKGMPGQHHPTSKTHTHIRARQLHTRPAASAIVDWLRRAAAFPGHECSIRCIIADPGFGASSLTSPAWPTYKYLLGTSNNKVPLVRATDVPAWHRTRHQHI